MVEFKRKLLSKIRPVENPVFNIYDIEGVRILTKLRLKFSALNEHRFRHRFNISSPLCNCGTANEDSKHFLLHCPTFYHLRRNLLGQLSEILSMDVYNFDDDFVCSLMLYGNSELPYIVNRMILEATLEYIKLSKRFVSLDFENWRPMKTGTQRPSSVYVCSFCLCSRVRVLCICRCVFVCYCMCSFFF